jgi:hypothetical protein
MSPFQVPKVYQQFRDSWERERPSLLQAYQDGHTSFVPNLLPEQALQLSTEETLDLLRRRLGLSVDEALSHADPDRPASHLPPSIQSPVAGQPDGNWLKRSNMVGVNVRTVGTFWHVVQYALTLPRIQNAIHLLPIWEPGVVGSLYGVSSWNINTEFYSRELAAACPALDSVEAQLKAVVNLLHAMGKAVGMDVIPHTDRYSEMALAFPHHFEWLQREGVEIVDHSADLHEEVQDAILDFLARNGPAVPGETFPSSRQAFFAEAFSEDSRLRVLFGPPHDRAGRTARRSRLVAHLYTRGYEPVPATMAPPYRGLEVDPETTYTDSQGNSWQDYRITHPQAMSRVFGPLARYKLYGRLEDNANWEMDFDHPRQPVWRYVCEHYAAVQRRYGFDFMRGDMSHVQMRPSGVPELIGDYYDILRAVKNAIRARGAPYFGYLAETFLAPRDTMLYGDESDHLEASDADTTLGDLQSTSVGSPAFLQRLRQYHDLRTTRSFAPTFAVITADKDDPRFDEFYVRGSDTRLFIALFLTDLPSYMGLGFETRDVHLKPAANECYTKLYVFQETSGPKATSGPYRWGRNGRLFHQVTRLRLYADQILEGIQGRPTRWLIPPDATGESKLIAWTQRDRRPDVVFVANTDTGSGIQNFNLPRIPNVGDGELLALEFSTAGRVAEADSILAFNGRGYTVAQLAAGEGRVYRVGDLEAQGGTVPLRTQGGASYQDENPKR